MFRLIEADLAATGKLHLCHGAPSSFLNCGALNILLREGDYLGFQVVAHEVEFVGDTTFVGGVKCGFCRRQGEDQPAVACIHGFKPEYVAEECAVRFGVFAVDDYVSARDHFDSSCSAYPKNSVKIKAVLKGFGVEGSLSDRSGLHRVLKKSGWEPKSRPQRLKPECK